jgi:hypothetical protein
LLSLYRAPGILGEFDYGIDLDIPLRAAERWLEGESPYSVAGFELTRGADLPFLYPPFVLPLLAPLLVVPRDLAHALWASTLAVAVAAALLRLGIPGRAVPIVFLWPPILEGIWVGNVGLVLFAAFIFALTEPPAAPGQPVFRRVVTASEFGVRDGALAAIAWSLKISQVHGWVAVLRANRRAALLGVAPLVVLAGMTLPFVGLESWAGWLAQAPRASDPTWSQIGAPLSGLVGRPLGLLVAAITLPVAFLIRGPLAVPCLGLLVLAAAPSLHTHGWLFALPAMLAVRRQFAYGIALLLATYSPIAYWLGFVFLASLLAISTRWPFFIEPPMLALSTTASERASTNDR